MTAWDGGGKEECLERAGLTLTHDELVEQLGAGARLIEEAGFVLVPRTWRDVVMRSLQARKP